MNSFDVKNLKKWFLAEQRDLPWRKNLTPYAVWVSEVMLQQTQVAVVIPYFEKWMELFPSIERLAEAPLDLVIKAWEGLGYYSRARNLHAGAKQIMEKFQGVLPEDEHSLKTVKGLGPYTVGAIRAFAFHQKAAAVDGNVLRVLSRYDCVEEDISKQQTIKKIRERAEALLPDEEPWIISEALIELGATVCSKQPKCRLCPLQSSCQAYTRGLAAVLPIKAKKIKPTILHRAVPVIMFEQYCLVRRGAKGEIMSDLHEFPYFETDFNGFSTKELENKIKQELNILTEFFLSLDPVRHGFTRYDVRLSPAIYKCMKKQAVPNYQWIHFDELDKLALSSGHRRIYQKVAELCITRD